MYIGPWQEYRLYNSKPKPQPGGSAVGGNHLKAELQAAILSTLDAESAKKAIEAMNPLLDSIKGNDNSVALNAKPKRRILQPVSKSNYRTDDDNQAVEGFGTNSSIPTLPSISSIYSARDSNRGRNSGTPTSVRSSQSEPSAMPAGLGASSRKFLLKEPPRPDLQSKIEKMLDSLPPLHQAPLDKQPAYNSHSMVHYLQADRNAREKGKLAKYWVWCDSQGGKGKQPQMVNEGTSIANSNSNNNSGGKTASLVDKKLVEVNKMKRLYTMKGDLSDAIDSELESPRIENEKLGGNYVVSKQAKHHQGNKNTFQADKSVSVEYSSPKIVDKELNQNDLNAVSKYFSKSEIDKFNMLSSQPSKPSAITSAALTAMRPGGPVSPIQTNAKSQPLHVQLNQPLQVVNSSTFTSSISTPSLKKPPGGRIQTPGDDLASIGNPDSLINWANGLDLDDFA
jgi:hypothetical protein